MIELSDETGIQRAVKQGCVAYPTLFNLYKETIFSHRYADDTAILAGNEKELSELTCEINEVGKQFGMKINIKKTKAMGVSKKQNSPKINISLGGQHIEWVT